MERCQCECIRRQPEEKGHGHGDECRLDRDWQRGMISTQRAAGLLSEVSKYILLFHTPSWKKRENQSIAENRDLSLCEVCVSLSLINTSDLWGTAPCWGCYVRTRERLSWDLCPLQYGPYTDICSWLWWPTHSGLNHRALTYIWINHMDLDMDVGACPRTNDQNLGI